MRFFLLTISLFTCSMLANAQQMQTIRRGNLTLTFTVKDTGFNAALKDRMIETFFTVYPKLRNDFNPLADSTVNFVIDSSYKGVAATGGGRVVYNPDWFRRNPGDIDVVTHEVMHIVQNYGRSGGPGWLTEGIADYVRFKYGVDNPGAKWSLTPFRENQSYTNSYRITARFLEWLETHGQKGLVKKLDSALRSHTFTAEMWKTETGKTLDELWAGYTANPTL